MPELLPLHQQLELFDLPKSPDRITVSDGLDILWRLHLGNKPSGRTYMSKRKALCRSMGHLFMDSVYDIDFENHRNARLNGLNGFSRVSIGTVFHDHSLLSLLFNQFRKWHRRGMKYAGVDFSKVKLPEENPTAGIRKVKAPPRKRIVTPDEFANLIEHSDEDMKEYLYIAIDTIIREGDLARLKPSNFNRFTDMISIVQGKTDKEQIMPATDRVRNIFLKAQREKRVFVLNSVNFRKRWETIRARSKLGDIQFRDLRKSGLNIAYRFCKDPKACQSLAGHSNMRTTLDHYILENKNDLKPLVNYIANVYH